MGLVKVHSGSQYLQFKGRLVYSKTCSEVDAAVHDVWEMVNARRAILPGNVAVGFDLEWKTSFQRGRFFYPWSSHVLTSSSC